MIQKNFQWLHKNSHTKKISCGQSYILAASTDPFSFPTGLQLLLRTRSIVSAISFTFTAISFISGSFP